MQYLKESVRNNIITSAIEEFRINGYKSASMRKIASKADIVSGNIYRYFKNKEDLFDSTIGYIYGEVSQVMKSIKKEISDFNLTSTELSSIDVLKKICEGVARISSKHPLELYILLDKSEGTKYAECKSEVIYMVFETLQKVYLVERRKKGLELKDNFMFQVLSSAFVDGMCLILKSGKNAEEMERLIYKWMMLMFLDIEKRLKR